MIILCKLFEGLMNIIGLLCEVLCDVLIVVGMFEK